MAGDQIPKGWPGVAAILAIIGLGFLGLAGRSFFRDDDVGGAAFWAFLGLSFAALGGIIYLIVALVRYRKERRG